MFFGLIWKLALIWLASSVFPLAQSAFLTSGVSVRTGTHVLTVKRVRLLCTHGAGSHSVRVRGYYASYPFFGPGPPATPVSYQTGYLFGHEVRTPIDSASTPAGILVVGPQLGVAPQLPAAGWVQVTGRWSCSTLRLELKSWRPSAHS